MPIGTRQWPLKPTGAPSASTTIITGATKGDNLGTAREKCAEPRWQPRRPPQPGRRSRFSSTFHGAGADLMPPSFTAKTPHIFRGRKHHIITAVDVCRKDRFRWLSLSFKIIACLLWQTMCFSIGETILMGDTSCPYREGSFSSESFLINGSRLDIITFVARLVRGEMVANDSFLHQFANLKSTNMMIPLFRFNAVMSYTVAYCQSSLLHWTRHRRVEFDPMTPCKLTSQTPPVRFQPPALRQTNVTTQPETHTQPHTHSFTDTQSNSQTLSKDTNEQKHP